MKKLIPLLGAAGLAVSGVSAYAQNSFVYNNGDILLDFSQSGTGASANDFEVDLGSLANLQSEAAANGGTVNLTTQANGYTLSQLSGNFANYNNLTLAVFGNNHGANDVDFFSKKRSNINTQNAAPNDISPSTASSDGATPTGIANGILAYGGTTTANVAIIANSSVDSYTHIGSTALGTLPGVTNVKNTTSSSFASGSIRSDLFEYDGNGSSSKAVYQGDFTFNSDGTLDYTFASSAVPEPSTYGIFAASGLLALSMRRQFLRQQI